MIARRSFVAALGGAALGQDKKLEFTCPMDPDVRSAVPAKCPRCGMKLIAGIPDPEEYVVELRNEPKVPRAGAPLRLDFRILHPKTGKPAELEVIHERLFHLFVISRDLEFFAHEHPVRRGDTFAFDTMLPKTGEYRLLCDFYPAGATPQMIAKTLILPGASGPPKLVARTSEQRASNLRVALTTDPPQPMAGKKTMLFFRPDPGEGLEPYLGARGHLLAASADLIDMIHSHPAFDEPATPIQFNVIFPRPGVHRVWVQLQRSGVVNTVSFDIPVAGLD